MVRYFIGKQLTIAKCMQPTGFNKYGLYTVRSRMEYYNYGCSEILEKIHTINSPLEGQTVTITGAVYCFFEIV